MATVDYIYVEYQGRYLVVSIDDVASSHKVYAESGIKNNAAVIRNNLAAGL